MKNNLQEIRKLQMIAGILKEDTGLVVRSLGGDTYDGGLVYHIEKDGEIIYRGTVVGDHNVEYNGQEYPDLESLSQALGAEFVMSPEDDEY